MYFELTYGKFWLDGDFFVRNMDASVELRHYKSLLQRKFFFSLQNGTLSFFFGPIFLFSFFVVVFFYKGLFSALDFSVSKDFSISKELLRVNF